MLCRRLFAALLFACVLMAPAFSTPAVADEASHRKAAEELAAASQMDKMFDKSIDTMLDAQLKMAPQAGQFRDIMRAFFMKYMSWDAMKEDIIKIYMDNFTEDELNQITTFYKTPVGQKAIQVMPNLMQQSIQVGQQRMQEHMPELQQQIMEAAKKSGGAPAQPSP